MDIDLRDLVGDMSTVKVVGNIPYNITTPIIFRLLERTVRPERIVIMIQREVADRILAEPASPTTARCPSACAPWPRSSACSRAAPFVPARAPRGLHRAPHPPSRSGTALGQR
jgi:16S rRNA A1518/A1519 N6-dimethyltransferase RsmA/KsgA/DIM1 with predicted DNA glycosylase/AP lyase activity